MKTPYSSVIERVVTGSDVFKIQMSTEELTMYQDIGSYSTEKEAKEAFDNIKLRLVQEAYITLEEIS